MLVVKVDIRPPPKEEEEIDLSQLNTFDILARTRYIFVPFSSEQVLTYYFTGIIWKRTIWSRPSVT